ncbi:MAG: DUF305 domain-containing protein [Siculibacillus sp.]|nr:DUF305 domain-containing protein [Siculibacillus sp.]
MRWTRIFPAVLTGAVVIFVGIGYAQRLGYIDGGARPGATAVTKAMELDRRFVDALIERYLDTMALAEEESRDGHNPELRRLAASLVEARKRELAQLMAIRTTAETSGSDPSMR